IRSRSCSCHVRGLADSSAPSAWGPMSHEPESATIASGCRSTPTQKLPSSMGVNPRCPVGVSRRYVFLSAEAEGPSGRDRTTDDMTDTSVTPPRGAAVWVVRAGPGLQDDRHRLAPAALGAGTHERSKQPVPRGLVDEQLRVELKTHDES